MITSIMLATVLILFSNLTTYRALRLTTSVKNLKEYFKYDEYSLVYVNITMFLLSAAIITITELAK